MEVVTEAIDLSRLTELAESTFGDMIKAVVDVDQQIMAVGGELHADEEDILLRRGSEQASLWGINIYPELGGDEWIEFDSMINLRPSRGNRSRDVEDPVIRRRIVDIVSRLVTR